MSTSRRSDDAANGSLDVGPAVMTAGQPTVYVYRADHVGSAFDGRIAACVRLLRRPDLGGLDRVSHHSVGVWDFTVQHRPDPGGDGPGGHRLGAQLSFQIDRMNEELGGLDTGRLFRVVLHAEQGAVICCSPLANQYAIALSIGLPPDPRPELALTEWEEVRIADRAVTELGNEIRMSVSQPPQNFGDLHRVALFSADTCEFDADVFDHPGLAGYFTQISVAARRQAYRAVGEDLAQWASQLTRVVHPTVGGRLLRLILDVEQGAIYYYRLAPNNYLVAVTLDQNRVSQTDDRVAQLALRIQQSRAASLPERH
jgi:hypothetical protein